MGGLIRGHSRSLAVHGTATQHSGAEEPALEALTTMWDGGCCVGIAEALPCTGRRLNALVQKNPSSRRRLRCGIGLAALPQAKLGCVQDGEAWLAALAPRSSDAQVLLVWQTQRPLW